MKGSLNGGSLEKIRECTTKQTQEGIEMYRELRSSVELNEEAVRSLKELVAYWQATMDAVVPKGDIRKFQYDGMIAERGTVFEEKKYIFLLDAQ